MWRRRGRPARSVSVRCCSRWPCRPARRWCSRSDSRPWLSGWRRSAGRCSARPTNSGNTHRDLAPAPRPDLGQLGRSQTRDEASARVDGLIRLCDDGRGWRAATHLVIRCTTKHGGVYQEQYRLKDGTRDGGGGRAELVNLPAFHTVSTEQWQQMLRIDALFREWARDRTDVERLRRLHDAIGECLQEEARFQGVS